MFSAGQIIFIFVFIAIFAVALIWAYRGDKDDTRKYYKGAWKVLIALILILGALVYILRISRRF